MGNTLRQKEIHLFPLCGNTSSKHPLHILNTHVYAPKHAVSLARFLACSLHLSFRKHRSIRAYTCKRTLASWLLHTSMKFFKCAMIIFVGIKWLVIKWLQRTMCHVLVCGSRVSAIRQTPSAEVAWATWATLGANNICMYYQCIYIHTYANVYNIHIYICVYVYTHAPTCNATD